jgi:O-antigen/teichoic acid export membrane protein
MVLAYLFQVVMARQLSTLEYGELSAILATLNVMTIPVFGLSMAVTRDVAAALHADRHQLEKIMRRYGLRVACVTAAMLAGVLLFNSWLSGFLQLSTGAPLVYLALLITLTNVTSTGRAILLGVHDFASVALNQVAEALVRLASGIAMAVSGFAATAGFGGYSLGLLLALTLVGVRMRTRLGARATGASGAADQSTRVAPEPRSKNPDISWSAIVVTGSFIVLLNTDLIVVKHFLPPDVAGQYAALSTLAKALFVITNAFDVVLFPMATAARASGASDGTHLRTALLSIGLIVGPILAVYWLIGGPLVSMLFGARYADGAPLLFPYALAITVLGLATLIARYRLAIGRAVPSWALLTTVVAAGAAFIAFHETLGQVVGVLSLTAVTSLTVALVVGRRQPTLGGSSRET